MLALMVASLWLLQKSEYVSPLGQDFEKIAVAREHTNEVRSKSASSLGWMNLEGGQPLHNFDQIFTHQNATVTLSFLNDSEVTVQENTLLRLQKTQSGTQLNLDRGFIVANLGQDKGREKLLFSVNGKIFEISTAKKADVQIVREGDEARVQVVKGEASLAEQGGQSFELEENSQTTLAETSKTEIFPLVASKPDSGQKFYTNSRVFIETEYTGNTEQRVWVHFSKDPFFRQTVERSLRKTPTQSYELTPGRYFWRLEDQNERALSLSTHFTVVQETPPSWVFPERKRQFINLGPNQEKFSADFEWAHEKSNSYLLAVSKNSQPWKSWKLDSQEMTLTLDEPGRYQVRVKVNQKDRPEALWSRPLELNISQQAPSTPALVSPQDRSQVFLFQEQGQVKLSWQRPLYADEFEVRVWGEFGTKTFLTSNNWLDLELDQSGIYEWEVVTLAEGVRSPPSESFIFEFEKKVLSASTPENGAVIELDRPEQEVEFEWKKVKGAKVYSFELSKDDSFRSLEYEQEVRSSQVKVHVPKIGTYYWRAKAVNSKGEEIYSKPYKVLLTPAPPPPKPELNEAPQIEYLDSSSGSKIQFLWKTFINFFFPPAYAQEKKVKLSWPKAPFDVKAYQIRMLDEEGNVILERQVERPEFIWETPKEGEFTWEMAYVDYWDRVGPFSDPRPLEISNLFEGVNDLPVSSVPTPAPADPPDLKEEKPNPMEVDLLAPIHGKTLDRPEKLEFKWTYRNLNKEVEKVYFELCEDLSFQDLLVKRELKPKTESMPLGIGSSAFSSSEQLTRYWRVRVEFQDGTVLTSKRRRLELQVVEPVKKQMAQKEPPKTYVDLSYSASQVSFSQTLENAQEVKVSGASIVGGSARFSWQRWTSTLSLQSGEVFEGQSFRSSLVEGLYRFDLPFLNSVDWMAGALASHQSSFELTSGTLEESGAMNLSLLARAYYQGPERPWSLEVDLLAGQVLGARGLFKFPLWQNKYFFSVNLQALSFSDERSQSLLGVSFGKRFSWY